MAWDKQDKSEGPSEQQPVKLSGAFGFMDSRPHDLVVVLKRNEDESRILRSLEIFYSVNGRLSSFQFVYSDPKYQGERAKFEEAALRALLKEVNSRHVAREDFAVWFYEAQDRRLIEDLASEQARQDPLLSRAVELLVERSKLIE